MVLLSMVFWGMSYIWSKIVFEYLSPGQTIFYRLIISVITLAILLTVTRSWQAIQTKHYPLFLISSLLNPFLYFIGESYGLQLVTPTVSAVMIATIPVFTPLFAFFIFNERLKVVNIIGLFFSLFGIIIILLVNDTKNQSVSITGILFLFGAVAAAVGHGMFLKKLTEFYKPIMIISLQNFIGIAYFLPFAFLFKDSQSTHIQPDIRLYTNLILLGVFASSLAFVFYTKSVQVFGISKSSLFANLIPVFTAIFSYYILKDQITTQKLIGMGLVIIGVILSEYNGMKTIEN